MAFVPIHNHSDYSLLDGASQIPAMVEKAVRLGFPALALTDHGVMYGAIELLKLCTKAGIKPIIGNEMYVINGSLDDPIDHDVRRYHLVVLAKNDIGYQNLVKLTTISHQKGVRGKGIRQRPCIDKGLLEAHKEGLIVSTACLGGEIPRALLQGRTDVAERVAEWYQRVFGDDFYLEIQDHGNQEDRIVNTGIQQISEKLGIKVVATNDAHYLDVEDIEPHDALLCILTNKKISDEKRLRYSGTEWLKSEEEMNQLFHDHLPADFIANAIANTVEIANKVEKYNILGKGRMPDFPTPEGYTPSSYLKELAKWGLTSRLGLSRSEKPDEVYRTRLAYELKVIEQMGFPTYFLVVWDYIRFAREKGIPVGPGRGSAAGSLVAYALGITNVDPVANGLLFERFLNPERKSMPDIDTDFCIERRGEVIDYVTRRYGEDKVAQIITFNRMTSKAVLKDTARVLGISYGDADQMAKMIPVVRGKPAKLEEMIGPDSPSPDFRAKYQNNSLIKHWIDLAIRIEGTNKTFGIHAAGIVISGDPLDHLLPVQCGKNGEIVTQYFMEDVEAMGLLKMDFLGLKNLTMIAKTVELIEEAGGPKLDPDDFPIDDQETFALIGKANLEGIFQLESSGMRQVVRDLRPSNFEDISSILALYRPGPLDAGLIPKFIDRKHGVEAIDFAHEKLESILSETYGVMVYQEQIMKIAQDLAGYSLGEADLLRRAMGKKKAEEMQKHQAIFVDGAKGLGIDELLAEELFSQMVLFAEYCFNKSHSTAYGAVTYQTAYLKAHYPVEYMAALLTVNSDNADKVQRYISNSNSIGIKVLPPDINASELDFTPIGTQKSILFGLSAIKALGDGAINAIIRERAAGPYKSLADLCDRLPLQSVNRRALEALIHSGALDALEPNANRAQLMGDLELTLDWASSRARDRAKGQSSLFEIMGAADYIECTEPKADPIREYAEKERLRLEKELLGFYLSGHPLQNPKPPALLLAPCPLGDFDESTQSSVAVAAVIQAIREVTTKKGDKMAILQLEDLTGSCEAVVFPRTYKHLASSLVIDSPVALWGELDERSEQKQLVVKDGCPLDELRSLVIKIDIASASDRSLQHQINTVLKKAAAQAKTEATVPVTVKIIGTNETRYVRLPYRLRLDHARKAIEELATEGIGSDLV